MKSMTRRAIFSALRHDEKFRIPGVVTIYRKIGDTFGSAVDDPSRKTFIGPLDVVEAESR